jgi:hypothetical protein
MSEGIFGNTQVGVPESWSGVIANIDAAQTPFSSMVKEDKKPSAALDNWQAETYVKPKHKPVVDGKDATEFEDLTSRKRIQGRAQKLWRNPKTSDFADNVNVVDGLSGDEQANQIARALTAVKHGMEARCLSNEDSQEDTGVVGHGTRGMFQWTSATAQSDLPVPAEFRPAAANSYSGTLANFDVESTWRDMSISQAIARRNAGTMHGFVGIKLKKRFVDSTIYTPNETGYTAIRNSNQNSDDGVLKYTTDVVESEGGTLILHTSFFLYMTEDGDPTDYTHRSGLFLDMDMVSHAFNRMPTVKPLEDQGGGARAIVDAIFCLRCYNPLGMGRALISADS